MNRLLVTNAVKFLVVGLLSTAVNYGVFILLFKVFKYNYLVASVTGYIVGLVLGFFLNNFWTFQHGRFDVRRMVGYTFVYLASLGLSTVFLWLTVEKFHQNAALMNVLAIGISTVSNFIGLKFFIYKNNEPQYAS